MNKQEAIREMMRGERVSHVSFSPDEWMGITKEGNVRTEEGCIHDFEEFWSYRTGGSFDDGYSIAVPRDVKLFSAGDKVRVLKPSANSDNKEGDVLTVQEVAYGELDGFGYCHVYYLGTTAQYVGMRSRSDKSPHKGYEHASGLSIVERVEKSKPSGVLSLAHRRGSNTTPKKRRRKNG